MDKPLLETRDLNKRFHALAAVNAVSLSVARGEVHAIIGPNGAGKTTLINLLSGDLAPSGGRVLFKDRDITGLSSDRISRLGISRSYQRTNIFSNLTCFENCWLAAQSRLKSSMRFVMPANRRHDVRMRTEDALEVCGLAARAGLIASTLSHGEQRQLELGMVLATAPELLLLDEPLAGMGSEEAAEIIELLRRLARSHTIVLIEHDMDAVFAIASRITVMVNGEVLATGSLDEIRQNHAVQEAYLGNDGSTE